MYLSYCSSSQSSTGSRTGASRGGGKAAALDHLEKQVSVNGCPATSEGRSPHKWLATCKSQSDPVHNSPLKGGATVSEAIVLSDSGGSSPPSPSPNPNSGGEAAPPRTDADATSVAHKRKIVASQVVFSDRRLEKRPRLQQSPPSDKRNADESTRPKQELKLLKDEVPKADMSDGPMPPVASPVPSSASTPASPDPRSYKLDQSASASNDAKTRSHKFRAPRGILMEVADVKKTVLELHRAREAACKGAPESEATSTSATSEPILSEIEQLHAEKKSIAQRDKVRSAAQLSWLARAHTHRHTHAHSHSSHSHTHTPTSPPTHAHNA